MCKYSRLDTALLARAIAQPLLAHTIPTARAMCILLTRRGLQGTRRALMRREKTTGLWGKKACAYTQIHTYVYT